MSEASRKPSLRHVAPEEFRDLYEGVPRLERDAWFDRLLGVSELLGDSSTLPRECVPFLPAPVDVLARFCRGLELGPSDCVVDVGSGSGRAAAFLRLFSGARVVGLEIQPHLASAARALADRHGLAGLDFLCGEANEVVSLVEGPSAFFLYCPFGGARLEVLLDHIEALASEGPLGIGLVEMPRLTRARFVPLETDSPALALHRVFSVEKAPPRIG